MKLYFIFTRRKLVAAALLLALTLCIAGRMVLVNAASVKASDDEARVRFAAECGCEVEKTAESVKKVRIPQSFSKVYERYNELQKRAGFDLEQYKGCEATVYSYKVLKGGIAGQETLVNLIVYRNRIIGGDISSTALNGKMLPLEKLKTE